MKKLKLVLLQARDADDQMGPHEIRCFADRSGLSPDQFLPLDLLSQAPSITQLNGFDGVMVGGSGDYYVSKGNLPHFQATLDFLLELCERGTPTFASCFGYQLMAAALGGEVIHDPPRTEVGTYELQLTEAGQQDELFGSLPPAFLAQMGHKDRVATPPEGIPNLARSELGPFQAMRIPGKAVWASQFHPELDRASNRERYVSYLDGYSVYMSPEERERALERFHESPDGSELLKQFLALVFG